MTDKPTPPSSPNDSAEKMNGGEENSSVLGNEAGVMVARVPPAVGEALLAERVDELINDLEEAFGGPPESGKSGSHTSTLRGGVALCALVGCSRNPNMHLWNAHGLVRLGLCPPGPRRWAGERPPSCRRSAKLGTLRIATLSG